MTGLAAAAVDRAGKRAAVGRAGGHRADPGGTNDEQIVRQLLTGNLSGDEHLLSDLLPKKRTAISREQPE